MGKSTLAWMLLEREGLPGCPTDALVSMLQRAAPEHGVRHGTHPDKAALAQPFLVEFIRAAAEALDASDPGTATWSRATSSHRRPPRPPPVSAYR
ncbi:hypothetical protein WKI68_01310 [Streptomyces sp. MS1.HAVA.3]|uniref:Uncharacterized protein n=1 Tax=Streptomyces caledonius TaxID=3134107 RepID=A0ABU8TXT7_9ACTN